MQISLVQFPIVLEQPKWLRTYKFAHRIVLCTVEQSSCIFSLTIAGIPVTASTRRLAMCFECFCRLSPNYTYLTCRNLVCQHSVICYRIGVANSRALIRDEASPLGLVTDRAQSQPITSEPERGLYGFLSSSLTVTLYT